MYNVVNYSKAKERLQNATHAYLKSIDRSITISAIIAVLCFVTAGSTGFLWVKQEKITLDFLSILTGINFCLSMYNILILPGLVRQRRELRSELFESETSDRTNLILPGLVRQRRELRSELFESETSDRTNLN